MVLLCSHYILLQLIHVILILVQNSQKGYTRSVYFLLKSCCKGFKDRLIENIERKLIQKLWKMAPNASRRILHWTPSKTLHIALETFNWSFIIVISSNTILCTHRYCSFWALEKNNGVLKTERWTLPKLSLWIISHSVKFYFVSGVWS